MSDTTTSTDGDGTTDDGGASGTTTGTTTTFSQAEVDRVVSERLARERAKFADYGELKSKAKRLAEIEDANRSETEKAVEKARAEARAEAMTAGNSRLVAAEARALAATARFRDPADAIRFLDLSTVAVDDDGTVDGKALTAQLNDLAQTKPYLVDDDGKAPPPNGFGGGARTTASTKSPADTFADLIRGPLGQR